MGGVRFELAPEFLNGDPQIMHPTGAAIERVITDYYRAHIIPDLRVLPQPLSEAGHA